MPKRIVSAHISIERRGAVAAAPDDIVINGVQHKKQKEF